MQIKIYNKDGKVRVTKIGNNGTEQTMYVNITDGQVATIDISVANLCVEGNLERISTMSREDMIMTLVVNHMEDRSSLEEMSDVALKEMMDYYHEEY